MAAKGFIARPIALDNAVMKKNTDMMSERIFLGALVNAYSSLVMDAKISEIAVLFDQERVRGSMRRKSVKDHQTTNRKGKRKQGKDSVQEDIRSTRDPNIRMTRQRLPSSISTHIRLIPTRTRPIDIILHDRTPDHRQCPCHESSEYLAERGEVVVEDAFGERVDEFGEDGDEDD